MTTIEKMARAIAEAKGDEFANAFANKSEWNAERGMSGGRFRDINEPYQSDYLDMARAALTALLEPSEAMLEAVITEPTHLYDEGLRGEAYQRDMKNAVAIERLTLAGRFRDMIQAALDEAPE